MGVYDIFGKEGAQVKAGPCEMRHYEIGDATPDYDNGIYLTYEGAVVISNGHFVGIFPVLDKWGGELDSANLIAFNNPVAKALSTLELPGEVERKVPTVWLEECKACGHKHKWTMGICPECGVHHTPVLVSNNLGYHEEACDGCQAYREHMR